MIPDHAQLLRIMSGQDRRPAATAWRAALSAMKPGYFVALRLHQAVTVPRQRDLGRPTVSLGNLTTGGTGKTPMTIELVRRLRTMGHRPAVLLRGYGGDPGSNANDDHMPDEVQELRRTLGDGVPVQPNPSRIEGAQAVLANCSETTCFVLDDGFQHRKARRDLDLVLIDATRPFGFGHLLPRGLLREPLSALGRADAVILTRADQVDDAERDRVASVVTQHHGRAPLTHAAHTWTALSRGQNGTTAVGDLADLRVYGVSGIGNPATFENQLKDAAGRVVGTEKFNDHYRYPPTVLNAVFDRAKQLDAQAVVTTEKDWVKWNALGDADSFPLPVYRPVVTMTFTQGGDALNALLQARLPQP